MMKTDNSVILTAIRDTKTELIHLIVTTRCHNQNTTIGNA